MISVIIPVYNVENYLNRCVDSVIRQITNDDEIILIDDGSKDRSPIICDEYASLADNIKVVHKKNEGLSMARNDGLDHANCNYVMFLDSDDYIEDHSIEKFKQVITQFNSDLITGKARWFKDDGVFHDKTAYCISDGLYSIDEYIKRLFKTKTYLPCAPFYLYNKQFLVSNKLRFYPGLLHEDEMWMPNVLLKARTIYYCDFYFYSNYRRDGSITQSKDNLIKGARDMCRICEMMEESYKSNPCRSKIFRDRMTTKILETFAESHDIEYFSEHVARSYPLKNAYSIRNFIKGLIYLVSPNLYLSIHEKAKGF